MVDMALEARDRMEELLSAEDGAEVRQSAMTWKGWQIWQKTENQRVLAFDGALAAIGDGEPELYGDTLVWDEGGEVAAVLCGKDVVALPLRELLEQTILVGE